MEIRTLIIVLCIANIGLVQAQYTAIPDNCFEQHLIDLGIDSGGVLDGQVLTSDINTITELTMNGTDINGNNYGCYIDNLQGIADFIALETLNININGLQHIDVSSLTNLKNLYCDSNYIQTLALPVSIEIVYARFNRFTQNIDLSQTTLLKEIHLDGSFNSSTSHITHINTDNCSNLIELTADFNEIVDLDIRNNTLLEVLSVLGNENQSLASFVHDNPNLKRVAIAGYLEYFNCDEMINLEEVQLLKNNFINLSFINNINLIDIRIGDNSTLEEIDIRNGHNNIVSIFAEGDNPNLTCIYVDNIQYSQANWTNIGSGSNFVETEIECNALGIETENIGSRLIKVYPNPVNDILNVDVGSMIIKEISIYDILGNEIIKTATLPINLTYIHNGTYIIKIKTLDEKLLIKKIVKIGA